jgi:AmmeMemoRadiSam system protein B
MRPARDNARVREPAVAGLFYPDDPAELRDVVYAYLAQARRADDARPAKALIVPHAGYIYSGSTAAIAYAAVAKQKETIRRVVLIGPSHRVYLQGIAVPEADAFATPLGNVQIDGELKLAAARHEAVVESDAPHRFEHSLEVQLPFLQVTLGEFTLLPLVGGVASAGQVASVLEEVWGDEHTLVLASSDLSHYHPYARAEQIDAATSATILRGEPTLAGEQACGAVAINGLLYAGRSHELGIAELARCNSGDTAGDRERVVGYGAYALYAA